MWIKICGLRDAAMVERCLELQVDAIGFVFAPSVRQVSIAEALRLAEPARGYAQVIAVLRDLTADLAQIVKEFNPDQLQIDQAAALAWQDPVESRPQPRAWLPVLREGEPCPNPLPPRLLFEGVESGNGMTANWAEAHERARATQLVLAGGLTPDNVAAAIGRVRPFGVDVSSGVERERGSKCPQLIKDFVLAARAAARDAEEFES